MIYNAKKASSLVLLMAVGLVGCASNQLRKPASVESESAADMSPVLPDTTPIDHLFIQSIRILKDTQVSKNVAQAGDGFILVNGEPKSDSTAFPYCVVSVSPHVHVLKAGEWAEFDSGGGELNSVGVITFRNSKKGANISEVSCMFYSYSDPSKGLNMKLKDVLKSFGDRVSGRFISKVLDWKNDGQYDMR